MRVGLISLETWDDVWRRNQHFAHQLIKQSLAEHITFVCPAQLGIRRVAALEVVERGITVVRPSLRLPKRAGGLAATGAHLRVSALRQIDVLWINDPTLGVHCIARGRAAVYDVTDDWREFNFPSRVKRRLVRAEDRLARLAGTVVCSEELRRRWVERYGVDPAVVHNGVDRARWAEAKPRRLGEAAPHVGYIGTLHEERLDVDLVLHVANERAVGQVHLVGPDALGDGARNRMKAHPKILLHGAVPADEVPAWTMGMDVLISPHLVTPFTLSLDAIKSYEYLVSGRPVVATPTSGFQLLSAPGLSVVPRHEFSVAVREAVGSDVTGRELDSYDWSMRAAEFASVLKGAMHRIAQ